jgi:hypothetical protein
MTTGVQREWLYGTIREQHKDFAREVVDKYAVHGVLRSQEHVPIRARRSTDEIAEANSLFKRQGMFKSGKMARSTKQPAAAPVAVAATVAAAEPDTTTNVLQYADNHRVSSPRTELKVGTSGKKVYHPHIDIVMARVAMSPYYTRRADSYTPEVLQLMDKTNLLSEMGVAGKHEVTELNEQEIGHRFEQVLAHTQQFVQGMLTVPGVTYQELRFPINEEILTSVREKQHSKRDQQVKEKEQRQRLRLQVFGNSGSSSEMDLARSYFGLGVDTAIADHEKKHSVVQELHNSRSPSPQRPATAHLPAVHPSDSCDSILHRQKSFQYMLQRQLAKSATHPRDRMAAMPASFPQESQEGSGITLQHNADSSELAREDLVDSLADYLAEKRSLRRTFNPCFPHVHLQANRNNCSTNFTSDNTHNNNNDSKHLTFGGKQQQQLQKIESNSPEARPIRGRHFINEGREIPNNYDIILDKVPEIYPLTPIASTSGIVKPLQGTMDLIRSANIVSARSRRKDAAARPVSANATVKSRNRFVPTVPRKRVDLTNL